jgi:hypothetical protein
MLNVVTSPIGIDARIKALQADLWAELRALWGIETTDWDSYPLCQRNYKNEGYIPEFLKSNGKDYIDVLQNDKVGILTFFGLDDTGIQHDGVNHETAELHLIAFVNLQTIKSNAIRSDIEIGRDFYNILKRNQYGFELQQEITGVDRVLSEYTGATTKSFYARADMRPHHCFRFNLTCSYNPKTVVSFT